MNPVRIRNRSEFFSVPRHAQWLLLLLFGGAMLQGCGGESLRVAEEGLAFSEPVLDLGRVVAGRPTIGHSELMNTGTVRVDAQRESESDTIKVTPQAVSLAAGERRLVEVAVVAAPGAAVSGEVRYVSQSGARASLQVRAEGVMPLGGLPGEIEFGEVPIGDRVERHLAMRSEVDEPLAVAVETSAPDEFQVTPSVLGLPSGRSVEVEIAFAPVQRGERQATLTLVPCEGCAPALIQLRGRGLGRSLQAEPAAVDFGALRLGEEKGRATVRLRNDGDLPLHLEARVDSEPFACGSGLDAALPPGAETEVSVEAGTGTAGAYAGRLLIGDRKGGDLLSVPLAVRVVPWVSWEPAKLAFGTQPPGRSVTKQVRLQAVGPIETRLLWVKLTNGDVPFRVSGPTEPTPIGPEPLEIDVTFEPQAEGVFQSTLVLDLYDSSQPRIEIPIQGAAKITTCVLEVFPSSLPNIGLGLLRSYTLHHRKFWLVNRGPGDCLIWDVVNRYATSLPARPSAPYLLQPGEAAAVPVLAWTEDLLDPPRSRRACDSLGHCVASSTSTIVVYHSAIDSRPFVFGYTAGAYPGLVVADPGFLEFDRVRRGDRATQVIRLSGPEDPANRWGERSHLKLTPDTSAAFSLEPFAQPDVGESLDGISFEVVFAPQEPGPHAGSIELQTAFVDKPLRILLFGVGD